MIDERETPTGSPGATGADVDQTDVLHLTAIVWKWKTLVLAGVLFVLAATFALLRLTPPSYQASTVLAFDQPSVLAQGEQGFNALQKLMNLMPTYAHYARSDAVLSKVQTAANVQGSLADLRARIDAAAVDKELAVRITARDGSGRVAERLVREDAAALRQTISAAQAGAGVPEGLRFVITEIERPDAQRPARNEVRTLVLAGLLGLAIMGGVAFLLEYVGQD